MERFNNSLIGDIQEFGVASDPQKEIWSVCQFSDEASLAYNESVTLSLAGLVDIATMRSAIKALAHRHSALRMVFDAEGEYFLVLSAYESDVGVEHIETEDFLALAKKQAVSVPFDLQHGPLFRANIVQGPDKTHIILTAHHIICDGWSMAILLRDLGELYTSLLRGREADLPAIDSYAHYIAMENAYHESGEGQKDLGYWAQKLSNTSVLVDLPNDLKRANYRTFDSARIDVELCGETVESIRKIGAKNGASFMASLLGAYQILIAKYTSQDDSVIAIPAAGQATGGLYNLVGHCVSTLPILAQLGENRSFVDIVRSLGKDLLDAYDHQKITVMKLLEVAGVAREANRIPLAPILFNVDQKLEAKELNYNGLSVDYESNPRTYENFEIFINITKSQKSTVLECQYNTGLYSPEWIHSHLDAFQALLRSIIASPQRPMNELGWAPSHQLEAQYFKWNDTQCPIEFASCIPIFVKQAELLDSKIAAYCGNEAISYADLNVSSNKWAGFLGQSGIKVGDMIGVSMERSIDMLTCLLGIMKAGGCYIPMDPSYPEERLSYMIDHSNCKLVISEETVMAGLPENAKDRLLLKENVTSRFPELSGDNRDLEIAADSPAYVIYTSGSTGRPKGVSVPHGALANFLMSMAKSPGLAQDDRLLAVTTISFDISGLELYLPLVTGASLVLARRDEVIDGYKLRSLLKTFDINTMQATPATWRMLLDSGWQGGSGFKALCGGEALPPDLAADLLAKGIHLWNMYGPTETTIWSTCMEIHSADDIHLGPPIDNTTLFVVDKNFLPVPWYVPGELLIGGAGVTHGYLNRSDLTNERFVQLAGVPDQGVIYRTGDLARHSADGALTCLGRNDSQVKIRGFRIELGEIESAIAQHELVRSSVVIVGEDTGHKRLIAYFEGDPSFSEVAGDFLQAALPAYMIPSFFVHLEKIPLLPNGKLDRKTLPAPDQSAAIQIGDEVEAGVESEVAEIWRQFLGMESVSANLSFFNHGGDSLLANRMLHYLQKTYKVRISFGAFLENQTIRELARLVSDNCSEALPAIPQVIQGDTGDLSIIQERVYYLDKVMAGGNLNLLPDGRIFKGDLDVQKFMAAIDAVFAVHPMLRVRIIEENEKVHQRIEAKVDNPVDFVDLGQCPQDDLEQTLLDLHRQLLNAPLDIAKDRLFRMQLIKITDEQYCFAYGIHHIIWDGWCFDIFWKDLNRFYFSNDLEQDIRDYNQGASYLDFVPWHREWSASETVKGQLEYWQKQLEGPLLPLEIPTDYPRPARMTYHGERVPFAWPPGVVADMTSLAHEEGTTTFVVMLTFIKVLLSFLSEQKDVIVGTPVQGRVHPDIANTIGYFVNTCVVRTQFPNEISFREALRLVKASVEGAYRHQDVAFEDILDAIKLKPDPSRTSLYSTMFAYQDTSNRNEDWEDLSLSQFNLPQKSVGSDLLFWLRKDPKGFVGGIDYRTDLFGSERVEGMASSLKRICEEAIADPDMPLAKVDWAQNSCPKVIVSPGSETLWQQIARNLSDPQMTLTSPGSVISGPDVLIRVQDCAAGLLQNFAENEPLEIMIGEPLSGLVAILAASSLGRKIQITSFAGEGSRISSVISGHPYHFNITDLQTDSGQSSEFGNPARIDVQCFDRDHTIDMQSLDMLLAYFQENDIGSDKSHVQVGKLTLGRFLWLLISLARSKTIKIEHCHSDIYQLYGQVKNLTDEALFVTTAELANLIFMGFEPGRDSQVIIVGDGLAQGLKDSIGSIKATLLLESGNGFMGVTTLGEPYSIPESFQLLAPIEVRDAHGRLLGDLQTGFMATKSGEGLGYRGYFSGGRIHLVGTSLQTHGECHLGQYLSMMKEVLFYGLVRVGEQLNCYILPKSTVPNDANDLKSHIESAVPEYLQADAVMVVDLLPNDPQGRVSYQDLDIGLNREDQRDYDPPETFAEKKLAAIWSEVLGVSLVGRYDNFFNLGGHSLLPLLVCRRIEEETGISPSIYHFLSGNLHQIAPFCGYSEEV